MTRITINSLLLVALLPLACRETYQHEKLSDQSPRFGQVQAMLDELRSDTSLDTILARQAAGLDESKQAMLRGTLENLRQADTVTLQRVDAFGPKIYRATFRLTDGEHQSTLALLLVNPRGEQLYWAGRN
jgi:type IV pilus biogenesis protein CpaD/CtpE